MNLRKFRIHICPIKGIPWERIHDNEKSAIVICSTTNLSSQYEDVSPERLCAVGFADVTDPELPLAIKEEHAAMIRGFILQLSPEISDLYLSCDCGESRSPAVAAAIITAVGAPDDMVWQNPFYHINTLVYRCVCRAFGINMDAKDIIRKKSINELAFRNAMKKQSDLGFSRWQTLDMDLSEIESI